MTIAMPVTIAYGKVVGRFIQAVADTVDVDLLPDVAPLVGNVTFMPATRLIKEISTSPPTMVDRPIVTASINAEGFLTSPAGDVGVWLVTGTYKVSYVLQGATIRPHDIVVLPGHTALAPLDVALAISIL